MTSSSKKLKTSVTCVNVVFRESACNAKERDANPRTHRDVLADVFQSIRMKPPSSALQNLSCAGIARPRE